MDSGIIIPEGYPFSGIELEEIISPYLVQKRVGEIGKEISELYQDKVPIIIGVLNGAFLFMADLVRHLHIQFEVDFIKIDWAGFKIDDRFVVGYGLDLKQIYRGLPGIYAINEDAKK